MPQALNREQSATLSDSSNDSGDLSLSCSLTVSFVENKESEVSEVEGDLPTVEAYQFEPIASDKSVESDTEAKDDDSEGELWK